MKYLILLLFAGSVFATEPNSKTKGYVGDKYVSTKTTHVTKDTTRTKGYIGDDYVNTKTTTRGNYKVTKGYIGDKYVSTKTKIR